MWRENAKIYLNNSKKILNNKLIEQGIVIHDLNIFNEMLLKIGEMYYNLAKKEEF